MVVSCERGTKIGEEGRPAGREKDISVVRFYFSQLVIYQFPVVRQRDTPVELSATKGLLCFCSTAIVCCLRLQNSFLFNVKEELGGQMAAGSDQQGRIILEERPELNVTDLSGSVLWQEYFPERGRASGPPTGRWSFDVVQKSDISNM